MWYCRAPLLIFTMILVLEAMESVCVVLPSTPVEFHDDFHSSSDDKYFFSKHASLLIFTLMLVLTVMRSIFSVSTLSCCC